MNEIRTELLDDEGHKLIQEKVDELLHYCLISLPDSKYSNANLMLNIFTSCLMKVIYKMCPLGHEEIRSVILTKVIDQIKESFELNDFYRDQQ